MQSNSFVRDKNSRMATEPFAKLAKSRVASIMKGLHLNLFETPQPSTKPTGPSSKSLKSRMMLRKLKTIWKRYGCKKSQPMSTTYCLANEERLGKELIECSSIASNLDHIEQVRGSGQLLTPPTKFAWKPVLMVHSISAATMETWGESSLGLAQEETTPKSEIAHSPPPDKHSSQPPLDAISLDDNEYEEVMDNDFLGKVAHTENYDISSDSDSDDDDDDFQLATKPFTPKNEVFYDKLTIRATTLRRQNNKLRYSPRLATNSGGKRYSAPQPATITLISRLRPKELELLSEEPPMDTLAHKLYTLRRQAMESGACFNCFQLPAPPIRLSAAGYFYGR